MECAVQILYYMFAALALGGALGVALSRGGLNSVMAMLVSTLGMSGMLFMMKAFFIAFIMAMVYAGAVMALFVFVIMLVGEERENLSLRRRACAAGLWALLCAACFFFARAVPQIAEAKVASSDALAGLNGYAIAIFSNYVSLFEIAAVAMLAAMVGVVAIAKDASPKRPKRDML